MNTRESTPVTATRLVPALVAAAVLVLPRLAWAQEEIDPDTVVQFAKLIKWGGVLLSLGVIAGVWVGLKFFNGLVARISEQFVERRLLLSKIATVVQFVVYVGTGIVCITLSFRLDDKVLALIGGTIAVSVGFAVKDLVASFIAGIMIMIDRPFQVGDRVSFGGQYGDITAIGLRSVRMQTMDDNTVTIPNNKFIMEITSNGNYGALDMQVVMDFHVGSDQDVVRARELVTEAAVTSRYVYLPKPVVVLVHPVIVDNYVAIRLGLKAYVLDIKYEAMFQTDVNLRVLQAFREHEIGPPAVLHRHLGDSPETARAGS